MQLFVYLVMALGAGVFVGFKICQLLSKRKERMECAEELTEGTYSILTSARYGVYYLLLMSPIDGRTTFPKMYRHYGPPPEGHEYLRAVSVNGKIVLKPMVNRALVPIKA